MKQYQIMLFDMDGVMTQELYYWKSAAMTVWEFLYQEQPQEMLAKEEELFKEVFCDKETILYAKRAGVNTNYDLTYVTAALAHFFKNEKHPFQKVRDFFLEETRQVPLLYQQCATLAGGGEWDYQGPKWHHLQDLFQSWYLGDGCEKPGFIQLEQPLFSPQQLARGLTRLQNKGISLGIGTGRMGQEIFPQLERWGLLSFFDPQRLATQTQVEQAQKRAHQAGQQVLLSKPHFYMFAKGMTGVSYDDLNIINREFDPALVEKTLIVGDAGADFYAAKALGADFAAVLTGVSGASERPFFEERQAEYIFSDFLEFCDVFG